MAEYKDQSFVEFVVRSIVNHPEDVKVVREIDERGIKLTLSVNPEDMGYVIGRSGKTAVSLRNLVKIVGAKDNLKVGEHQARRESEHGSESASERVPEGHGDSGLVSDSDLADLGI
jgi:predicted RNA-binding protein YlqC (UPF0109 family)